MVSMLRISQASLDALTDNSLKLALDRAAIHLLGPDGGGRAAAEIAVAHPRARAMRLEQQGHVDAFLALVLDLGLGAEAFLARAENAALIQEPQLAGHQKLFALIERARQDSPTSL